MQQIQSIIGAVIDLLVLPFAALQLQWLLWAFSSVTAVGSLLIFKYSTNQATLRQARNRIQGYLLEMRLFKDSPRLMLSAQWGLLKENARCMFMGLLPLLIMAPPLLFLFPHLENRLAWRPLRPGEQAIIQATLKERNSSELLAVNLVASEGIILTSSPLRIPSLHEIDWRIEAQTQGRHPVFIKTSGQSESIEVFVTNGSQEKIIPEKRTASWWNDLLGGGAPQLSSESVMQKIVIIYPEQEIPFLFWKWNWLVVFLVEVLLVGWILKYFLKVEI